jgi:hypothetical protein
MLGARGDGEVASAGSSFDVRSDGSRVQYACGELPDDIEPCFPVACNG